MSSHFPFFISLLSLIKWAAWAGCLAAALACVALLVRARRARHAPAASRAKPPYTGLNGREQAIIAACADALFPPGGPIPLSGTDAGVVRYIDRYLGRVPASQRRLMRLLFQAVEHSPALFGPTRARFTRLTATDRVAVLEAMSRSRIYFRRVMFLSLRLMLTMGYLAHPEVARRIGVVFERAPFEGAAASTGEKEEARAGDERESDADAASVAEPSSARGAAAAASEARA